MEKSFFDFTELAENWTAPLLARREIERFTGGAMKARTFASTHPEMPDGY
jgi:hypothetical protein